MKKTILILILVIYIASIAIVNFFGLEIKIFESVTYVDSIECPTITVQNENSVTLEAKQLLHGKPLFVFDFIPAPDDAPYTRDDESIITNPNTVRIDYEVFPHLADETGVRFEFDEETLNDVIVFHEMSRSFVFLKPNKIVTITIRAIDGSNKSTEIQIVGKLSK